MHVSVNHHGFVYVFLLVIQITLQKQKSGEFNNNEYFKHTSNTLLNSLNELNSIGQASIFNKFSKVQMIATTATTTTTTVLQ